MSVEPKQPTPDHPRIWLQPRLPAGVGEDRVWCEDNVWAGLPECQDNPPTEYVRHDLYDALADKYEALLNQLGATDA